MCSDITHSQSLILLMQRGGGRGGGTDKLVTTPLEREGKRKTLAVYLIWLSATISRAVNMFCPRPIIAPTDWVADSSWKTILASRGPRYQP